MQFIRTAVHQILSRCGLEIRRMPGSRLLFFKPYKLRTGQNVIREFERIENLSNSNDESILILQPGRTASVSTRDFLRNNGINPFYTHALSDSTWTMIEYGVCGPNRCRSASAKKIRRQRLLDCFLRNELFLDSYKRLAKPTKIITVFRDPICKLISHFFRELSDLRAIDAPDYMGLPDLIEKRYGVLNLESIKRYFLECVDIYIETYVGKERIDDENYRESWEGIFYKDAYIMQFLMDCRLTLIWFDWEINGVFGFDIYSEIFDTKQGYSIYKVNELQILAIEYERFGEIAAKQIGRFLKFPDLETASMLKINTAKETIYGDLRKEFLSTIVLPKKFVDHQYSSQYAKFFYSEEKLKQFTNRWIGGAEERK